LRIVDHLENVIKSLTSSVVNQSVWNLYYEEEILNEQYLNRKKELVKAMVKADDKNVIDLGCNRGLFSNLVANTNRNIVAADDNAYSISKLYKEVRQNENWILPLCIDLMNPPGDAGFGNAERKVFYQRMSFDLCLSLALVHHICIGKNVPFEKLAVFLSQVAKNLIIEFIPKQDEKVQLLLSGRKDIFPNYDQAHFESAFNQYFIFDDCREIEGSERIVYRMKIK